MVAVVVVVVVVIVIVIVVVVVVVAVVKLVYSEYNGGLQVWRQDFTPRLFSSSALYVSVVSFTLLLIYARDGVRLLI